MNKPWLSPLLTLMFRSKPDKVEIISQEEYHRRFVRYGSPNYRPASIRYKKLPDGNWQVSYFSNMNDIHVSFHPWDQY